MFVLCDRMVLGRLRGLRPALRLVLLLALTTAPQANAQTRSVPPQVRPAPAAPISSSQQPKFKGIWEPVSYPDDVKWFDVFFATADEGWVAGGASEIAGGMIIHTSDGGDHWDVQYGDLQSADRAVTKLRFLDQTHGWAVQSSGGGQSRLLHTRDGKFWMLAGTIDAYAVDYMFTTETYGAQITKGVIRITQDGGRSWKPVFQCVGKVQVDGLSRNVNCEFQRLQVVSPNVAYVVAKGSMDAHKNLFLAKTTDGGMSWTMTTQELPDAEDMFFIDENTGFIRAGFADSGQIYKTTDGGQTWVGMAASPGRRLQFADPEVGWSVLYRKVSFTTDGGNRWNSREYPFPTSASAFSLSRRDRGYVVGEHGMIYRYRIVPVEYASKGMIPAPLLSGIDSPLEVQVQQLATQVQQLAKDAGVPPMDFTQGTSPAGGPGGFSNSGTNPTGTSPSASGATAFNPGSAISNASFPISVPGCPALGMTGTSTAMGNNMPSSTTYNAAGTTVPATGFTQDTANTPPTNAPVTSGGFVQDTGEANTTLMAVSTTVPQFVDKYRNLNLTLTGWQTAAQMPATVLCLKQSFQALKNVKDPQATMAAVTNIQGQVGGLLRMVRMAFSKSK